MFLLLAAGYSKRFGGVKLNAVLGNGLTVYQQTLSNLRHAADDILVITRADIAPLIDDSKSDIRIFPDAHLGMGATLAFGVRQIISDTRWQGSQGCLVCLADMPFIQPQSYASIASKITRNTIVVPNFLGKWGNPVGFGCEYFNALSAMNSEVGGRELIKANSKLVNHLPLEDPGILQDIDTPQDLSQAIRQN